MIEKLAKWIYDNLIEHDFGDTSWENCKLHAEKKHVAAECIAHATDLLRLLELDKVRELAETLKTYTDRKNGKFQWLDDFRMTDMDKNVDSILSLLPDIEQPAKPLRDKYAEIILQEISGKDWQIEEFAAKKKAMAYEITDRILAELEGE